LGPQPTRLDSVKSVREIIKKKRIVVKS